MLNSAHFVIFPFVSSLSPKAPPMIDKRRMCEATSGNVANNRATFVSAPVDTTAHDWNGVFMIASRIARMAFPGFGSTVGTGRRLVPSMPDSPWMAGAWTAARMNGLSVPA